MKAVVGTVLLFAGFVVVVAANAGQSESDQRPLTEALETEQNTDLAQARPSFDDVQAVFSENCVRCHGGSNPAQRQNLSEGHAYASIVNQEAVESDLMRVRPGEPNQSYLYLKITDQHLNAGGRGRRMPLGQPALSDADIATIRGWIQGGARP